MDVFHSLKFWATQVVVGERALDGARGVLESLDVDVEGDAADEGTAVRAHANVHAATIDGNDPEIVDGDVQDLAHVVGEASGEASVELGEGLDDAATGLRGDDGVRRRRAVIVEFDPVERPESTDKVHVHDAVH